MRRIPFLLLALGLFAGLMACQDGGVVAPDDIQPQFAKVKDCSLPNPHPSCPNGGGGDPGGDPTTALVKFETGFTVGNPEAYEEWDAQRNDFKELNLTTLMGFTTNLSFANCKYSDPIGQGGLLVEAALIRQLNGITIPAADPEVPTLRRISIDRQEIAKKGLPSTSTDHRLQFNYISDDPDLFFDESPGVVILRVGGMYRLETATQPEVLVDYDVPVDDDNDPLTPDVAAERFTFTGGTVLAMHWVGGPNSRALIECDLDPTAPVKVVVVKN